MDIRNRNSKLIALTAALAAAMALPAMAQSTQGDAAAGNPAAAAAAQPQPANGGAQTWASVDTDGDGAISKQEAQINAGLTQIFDQADSDKDGKLTIDEYKAYVASQQAGATQP